MFSFYSPNQIPAKERGVSGNVLPEPLTKKRSEDFLSIWSKIVRYRESGCIYYYSKPDLLRRFRQYMAEPKLLKKYFGNQKILIIDAEALIYEDLTDWMTIFDQSATQTDAYFVTGLDTILQGDNHAIITFFEHIISRYPTRAFLFFFTRDFSHPSYESIFKGKSYFKQFEIFHPLHTAHDAKQFIHYLQKKWNFTITSSVRNKILEECGTHYFLIKEAVRYLRDHYRAEHSVFNHPEMAQRLANLWNQFLPSEQSVLKKVAQKLISFEGEEAHSFAFLQKTGWIEGSDSESRITIRLLHTYISNLFQKNSLTCDFSGNLSINGLPLIREFTKQEQMILRLLLNRKMKLVTRNTMALTLWGAEWTERYSDWAIDRIIHRIRSKMKRLGVKNAIKTVHGKGFTFS